MPLAEISFGELLLSVVEIFVFVIWFWILFTILGDLFSDHEMPGWAKALWILFLVLVPFISMVIYLVARDSGMRARALQARSEARHQKSAHLRVRSRSSPAGQLDKLHELKEKGALSDEEFERAKAKVLG